MVSTLARLPRVDPAAVGLADLGRPDGYVSRQVERWTRQYRASEHTRIAPLEEVIAWIGEHAPHGEAGVLIHGDFRLDTLIFYAREPRIEALDRKSVVEGKGVAVRVDLGGRRHIKKKTTYKIPQFN